MGRQRRRAVGHDDGKRSPVISEGCGQTGCHAVPDYVVVGPLNGSQGGPGLLAQCWVCSDHVHDAWGLFYEPETLNLAEMSPQGVGSFLGWFLGQDVAVPIVQMVA